MLAAAGCMREHVRWEEAQVHLVIGNMLKASGDLESAIAEYREAVQIEPNLANTHYELGRGLHVAGKLDEAIEEYRKALNLEPYVDVQRVDFFRHHFPLTRFKARVHTALGNALGEQGDLEGAIAQYRQALVINPDYARAHYNLGSALEATGNSESAIPEYEAAIQAKPDLV